MHAQLFERKKQKLDLNPLFLILLDDGLMSASSPPSSSPADTGTFDLA
jgi:hypothetical protein